MDIFLRYNRFQAHNLLMKIIKKVMADSTSRMKMIGIRMRFSSRLLFISPFQILERVVLMFLKVGRGLLVTGS